MCITKVMKQRLRENFAQGHKARMWTGQNFKFEGGLTSDPPTTQEYRQRKPQSAKDGSVSPAVRRRMGWVSGPVGRGCVKGTPVLVVQEERCWGKERLGPGGIAVRFGVAPMQMAKRRPRERMLPPGLSEKAYLCHCSSFCLFLLFFLLSLLTPAHFLFLFGFA